MRAWEKNFRQVVPYVPGEQPQDLNIVKLNTNESPYPPAPGVIALEKEINAGAFRRYPDYQAKKLVKELARHYKLKENQIFVGVGSDDVLAMCFLTFFNSKTPILFPDITYSFYKTWAELYQIPYECPPVDDNFRIQKEDYYKKNGGVIIANPNAPTSIAENREFFREILEHNHESIVIVDEAYIDFGGESTIPLIEEYENLLVVQTFSKSRSMAGMRIGYAMGNERLIQALNDVKYSFNSYTMNTASIELGAKAVEEDSYYQEMVAKIKQTREIYKKRLIQCGFEILDSDTNFLFAKHKNVPAKEIFEKLREKSIYVRHFDSDRVCDYLRITIGTDQEMEKLMSALKDIL